MKDITFISKKGNDINIDFTEKEFVQLRWEDDIGFEFVELDITEVAKLRNSLTYWLNNKREREAKEARKNAPSK